MTTHFWATIRKALRFMLCSLAILLGLASIIATGGSGGGGGAGVSGGAGVGTVALSLGDGPADDYDHIWVYVTKVSLIPAPGNNAGHVVIYQSLTLAGHKVDLLAYRDEDFFLGIKNDVPAGRYEKIRLEVADIVAEGQHQLCTQLEINLPSGKIDLSPRGGFEVRPGESLAIRLDMDANKSINLHPSGNSGKCIFRPVVFVDITPGTVFQRCPVNITGVITDLIDRDQNGTSDGFVVNLIAAHGLLTVWLDKDAPIFDVNGRPVTPTALAKGQEVWARGRLNSEARFLAGVAVVGQVLTIDGVAQGPVQAPLDTFPFLFDLGQGFVGQPTVNVQLYKDQTLVFRGCDSEVGWDAIAKDVQARVFGKLDIAKSELRAAVVLLRHVEISGDVLDSQPFGTGGRLLTIQTSDGNKFVIVQADTPIFLEGDGSVPLDLVCAGTRVRVLLDPGASQPTAAEVKVLPDLLDGTVTGISPGNTLQVRRAGETVDKMIHVRSGATIIDQRGDADKLIGFADIKIGDRVKAFGLKPSLCNSMFEAFVVLLVP